MKETKIFNPAPTHPLNYEEREKLKREFHEEFHRATDLDEKYWLLLHKLCQAHYWRAREHLEDRKDYRKCISKIMGFKCYEGYKLEIDRYSEHWLAAMSAHPFFTKELVAYAKSDSNPWRYDFKPSPYLPPGFTSYVF